MEGLNNLQLNGQMLAALYGNSIIDLTDKPENKSQKTLVLFKDTGNRKLPDNQYKFLEQVLKACRIDMPDVEIVNVAGNNIALENIIDRFSPHFILSFGTGTGTELFAMKNTGGTKYLNAPEFAGLMQDTAASKQMKSKLWSELKAMFNL